MCFWLEGTRKGAGQGLRLFEFEFKGEGGRGWGGRLLEAGRLLIFLPSGWVLIRGGR